jgi:L-asparaginase
MEKFKTGYSSQNKNEGVLIIYTGGTIGSMPKDRKDPDSPQVVVSWEEFLENSPLLHQDKLGFNVDAYSTEPLDSCNLGPAEWQEMARVIKESYDKYEGFVILHGTDTMVYTASVLSFMLQNLAKPVIITGAQMTYLFNVRNDGWQNLISALMVANPKYSGIPIVPEVCIYFGGKLMRGNRTRKINATGFDAYTSPNYKPIAELGDYIEVDESLLMKTTKQAFNVRSKLSTDVVAINFFPGLQNSKMLPNILKDESLKGVVLLSYGAGNIPTDKHILKMIKKAHDRGVIFLNVTQTGGGRVELGMYETSAMLLDVGVVSGVDITPEAALVKMMVLLGDEDLSPKEVELMAQINLAGEQSLSIFTTLFKIQPDTKIDTKIQRYRIPAVNIEGFDAIDEGKIDRIMLRFKDGFFSDPNENGYISIKLFADLSSDDELNTQNTGYLGSFNKLPSTDPTVAIFDITETGKQVITSRSSFTVNLDGTNGEFSWSAAELVIYAQS